MIEDSEISKPLCADRLTSIRKLFIKRKSSSPTVSTKSHQKQYPRLRASSRHIAIISFFTICLLAIASLPQVTSGQSETKTSLPTVIVRGFLNYRTTVDGTVLLFTPDAGGSSSSSIQAISSTPTLVTSSTPFVRKEPSRVSSSNGPTSFFLSHEDLMVPAGQLIATSSIDPARPTDEWSSIQMTPPLRPVQTMLPQSTPERQSVTTSSQDLAQRTSTESSASWRVQTDSDSRRSSLPSVQADDILITSELASSAPTQATTTAGTEPTGSSATEATSSAKPSLRPKRPSLGFTGQGLRSRTAVGGRSIIQSQDNTINGIRRPGLSTTTAAPSTASSGEIIVTPSPSLSAFQGRLTNASAKIRNKFKKSNLASNSSLVFLAQSSSIVSEDMSSRDLAPLSISADTIGALQSRMGDIFNPTGSVGISPVVGSDEVLAAASIPTRQQSDAELESLVVSDQSGITDTKPESRLGDQRVRSKQSLRGSLSGPVELQQGQLGTVSLSLDSFFQGDQPVASSSGEQPIPIEPSKPETGKKNNDKLNGWLDQHHNKFISRPAIHQAHQSGQLSQQLVANLNSLAPSFVLPTISLTSTVKPVATKSIESLKPSVGALDELTTNSTGGEEEQQIQMQTITKTYSTIMTSFKTRMVPLQIKSSTAIHTITESYVITKMLTAFQTMPVGEFILPESLRTQSLFEMFNEPSSEPEKSTSPSEQPKVVPNIVPSPEAVQQEQPISLDSSTKSANDWLHDFSNSNNQDLQNQQQNLAVALLERQAQEANGLAALGLTGEPLDQLASNIDPVALLADGTISIPDLNNPFVLAAIQNPQLAAVILAAQQLQLKQRANKLNNPNNLNPQSAASPQIAQLQPSYSVSLSTTIKPSTYTVRDTMYTTRLVSFKDGRTMRTRTVSEPGSVIEQVLTTMATEVTPITHTIRPTGLLTLPSSGSLATASPSLPSNQATINNALFATQLASILARRQQQVQPSLPTAGIGSSTAVASNQQALNQLAALQQLIGQQQRPQSAKQFQPNLQQLMQSMQLQQNSNPSNPSTKPGGEPAKRPETSSASASLPNLTPALPAPTLPIATTLTSLHVRTYTVHNAFKTIYRTITSTELITSTLFPGSTRLAS